MRCRAAASLHVDPRHHFRGTLSHRPAREKLVLVCQNDPIAFGKAVQNFGEIEGSIADLHRARLNDPAFNDEHLVDKQGAGWN